MEFADGITAIVGSSDSGKSAILRALAWTTRNRPSGDWMISDWATSTKVIIETDTDVVERVKGKESSYTVSGTILSAFGTNVPDRVQAALPLQESNCSEQLDAPFLISLPEGQIAQYFNQTIGLSEIDQAVVEINTLERTTKAKMKKLTEEEDTLSNRVVDEDLIESLQQRVGELLALEQEEQAKLLLCKKLESLIASVPKVPVFDINIKKALLTLETETDVQETIERLERMLGTFVRASTKKEETSNQLAVFSSTLAVCETCGGLI